MKSIEVKGLEVSDKDPKELRDLGEGILGSMDETPRDLDDYTVVDPTTGNRVIDPNSEQANSRDADGDPITDGGM